MIKHNKCFRLGLLTTALTVALQAQVTLPFTGVMKQISASSDGEIWGVDSTNQVYRWNGSDFAKVSGTLTQVAVGSKTNVWGIDSTNHIFKSADAGRTWAPVAGSLTQISVAADGTVAGSNGTTIFKLSGTTWTSIGNGTQVVAGSASNFWALQSNGAPSYSNGGATWVGANGALSQISVASTGRVSGATATNDIFDWNPQQSNWTPSAGKYAAYVAVDNSTTTSLYLSTTGQVLKDSSVITWSANTTSLLSPVPLNITQPKPPAEPQMAIINVGSILCGDVYSLGNVAGKSYCLADKADYVGPYSVNLTCPTDTTYSSAWGGTCWSCPLPHAGYRQVSTGRTSVAVKTEDAWYPENIFNNSNPTDEGCVMKPSVKYGSAVYNKAGWAWNCDAGQFWNSYDPQGNWIFWGGSCWSCPSPTTERTIYSITGTQACVNSTADTNGPAILAKFNGCPTPDGKFMGLTGLRTPGRPFLDIAAGWSAGSASGGCFACAATDTVGNVLVSTRNPSPITGNVANNVGCNVEFSWTPTRFFEPGVGGFDGLSDMVKERGLFDNHYKITTFLTADAQTKGFASGSAAAAASIAQGWNEIAKGPYLSPTFRALLFAEIVQIIRKDRATYTDAEKRLIASFSAYVKKRRIYAAQEALNMYDAWTVANNAKQAFKPGVNQFYFGTVPLDFHAAAAAGLGLGTNAVSTLTGIARTVSYWSLYEQVANKAEIDFIAQNTLPPVDPSLSALDRLRLRGGVNININMGDGDVIKAFRAGQTVPDLVDNVGNLVKGADRVYDAQRHLLKAINIAQKASTLNQLDLSGINVLKALRGASAAAGLEVVVEAALAAILSVAIEEFIAINEARPKLSAALNRATNQTINLAVEIQPAGGLDGLGFFWSKATDSAIDEPGFTPRAADLARLAAKDNYIVPQN